MQSKQGDGKPAMKPESDESSQRNPEQEEHKHEERPQKDHTDNSGLLKPSQIEAEKNEQ